MEEKVEILLITVGGSPEPIIFSINTNKPNYVIYFASKETEEDISKIESELSFKPKFTRRIIVSDANDFNKAVKKLKKNMEEIFSEWGIDKNELYVDFTGGTKAMVGAVVFATIEYAKNYIYIGGKRNDKGKVISGTEKIYNEKNPYIEYFVKNLREAENYFSVYNYNAAISMIDNVLEIMKKQKKKDKITYLEAFKIIIEGFQQWDLFNHKRAHTLIYKGISRLGPVRSINDKINSSVEKIEKLLDKLNLIISGDKRELLMDLIANAKRRGDIEGKYDDAVARLYSVLEKIAQYQLKDKYGIDTSDIDESKIPGELKEKMERYYDADTGKIKVGLKTSYEILYALNDEIGKKFMDKQKELKRILNARNKSILAHGNDPIRKENYLKILDIIWNFTNFKQNDLPNFPKYLPISLYDIS